MRVLFSVYNENLVDGVSSKLYDEMVETAIPIKEIDPFGDITDGFKSMLFVGRTLSFWDIYCFHDQEQIIIQNIKSIPRSHVDTVVEAKEPSILIIQYHSDDVGMPISSEQRNYYYYQIDRFECGASSIGEVIAIICNNPWFVGILTGVAANQLTPFLHNKITKLLHINVQSGIEKNTQTTVRMNIDQLKKNFSKISGIKKTDYQIIDFEVKRFNNLELRIRTADNRIFEITATRAGMIKAYHQTLENK